jgi:hypothetical protein
MRLPILLALLLPALTVAALPVAAQQRPGTVLLEGRAQTGTDSRAVRFEFHCSENGRNTTGALGVDLYVPRYAELAQVFDFDAFEGPDADAGARTRIEVGSISGRFTVSGWAGVADDNPFGFGLTAPRRRDPQRLAAVARVLQPLTTGPATLTWTQQNAGRSGSAITARLVASAEDSVRLRVLLAPCLGR